MDIEEIEIETPGLDFAALSAGDGDRYVFMFHGFPDDAGSMAPLMEVLVENGYRCVAPYMRGYGSTETPTHVPSNYSIPKLAGDVLSVIGEFDAEQRVVLGHDWGAIAVTTVSTLDPASVDRCISMAVPPNFMSEIESHPSQVLRSWYMALLQVPGLAEESLRRDNYALIERLWNLWSPNWEFDEDRINSVKETFDTDGTVEAAVMYYRSLFEEFLSKPSDTLEIKGIQVPTLLITGRNDGAITSRMFEGADRCYEGEFRLDIVDGAGHFVHAEKPFRVGESILEFLE